MLDILHSSAIALRLSLLLLWVLLGNLNRSSLLAQAPLDEWRRGGIDAMVAQPGQAASMLSNPAGIKTKEQRHKPGADRKLPGSKQDWIFELVSADTFLSRDTWNLIGVLLSEPDSLIADFRSKLNYASAIAGVVGHDANEQSLDLIKSLGQNMYGNIRKNMTDFSSHELPTDLNDLTLDHLENLSVRAKLDLRDLAENIDQIPELRDLPARLAARMSSKMLGELGDLSFTQYLRLIELRHVNDEQPLAWGFSAGIEQKAVLRSHINSLSMPLSLRFDGFVINANIPIGLQAYGAIPLRAAIAHDFNETIPGFTFGLGFKAVPYLGINQEGLGRLISNYVYEDVISKAIGINLGIDFGMQYHFGAITPKLAFLHAGFKISDLVGFNIPFSTTGDKFRYAIDFDFGVYADYSVSQLLQVFGGAEFIQIRGLFPGGQSPYSALFEPIDHLRLLGGVSLLNNLLRLTAQYYNSNISLGALLNLNIFQFHAALNLSTTVKGSWGVEFTIRFRGPHDGINVRRPYRTYAQLAAEKQVNKAKDKEN